MFAFNKTILTWHIPPYMYVSIIYDVMVTYHIRCEVRSWDKIKGVAELLIIHFGR